MMKIRMRMLPDKGFVFPLGHPASISIIYQPGIIIITTDSSGWNCQKHHHLNHHNCITSSFSTFIKSCSKKKRPGMRPTVFPKLLRALWIVSNLLHFGETLLGLLFNLVSEILLYVIVCGNSNLPEKENKIGMCWLDL